MSEECIAAIVTAQQQCQRLQLVEVSSDVMLAGCIDHPETRAMERTLQASKITWRATTAALKERYAAQDDQQVNRGWLAGFRAASDDDNDRPFGKDLKLALTRAGKLADAMKSTSVRVHHVFLALLDYKETNGEMKCGADETPDQFATWTLMQELPGWDSSTTALQVCETLLANLKESSASAENQGPELVTGQGRGSSSTPTLEECGVDLTQQARDGRLDVVFGRDEEIRACLRTLLRRRKNCVCLIGDPGVGKVSCDPHVVSNALATFLLIIVLSDCHCGRRSSDSGRRGSLSDALKGPPTCQFGACDTRSRYQIPRRV